MPSREQNVRLHKGRRLRAILLALAGLVAWPGSGAAPAMAQPEPERIALLERIRLLEQRLEQLELSLIHI